MYQTHNIDEGNIKRSVYMALRKIERLNEIGRLLILSEMKDLQFVIKCLNNFLT